MLRIPVEVYVIAKEKVPFGVVSVFYVPTGHNLSDVSPIQATYPLDVFPSADKLETGMRKMITVHEEDLRKLQL
jgi:hypothetical protein